MNKNEIRKIKYHLYREAGYSSKDAQRLRDKQLDIGNLSLINGQVPKDSKEFKNISEKLRQKRLKQERYNEIRRIRYHALREAGYTSKKASQLSSRSINIGNLKTDKHGKVDKNNPQFKKLVDNIRFDFFDRPIKPVNFDRINKIINDYKVFAYNLENDTVYTDWGMLTHDKRYRDKTLKVVKMLQQEHNLSNDQAFYMLYYMFQFNKSYSDAIDELLSSRDFEMYVSRKHKRGI